MTYTAMTYLHRYSASPCDDRVAVCISIWGGFVRCGKNPCNIRTNGSSTAATRVNRRFQPFLSAAARVNRRFLRITTHIKPRSQVALTHGSPGPAAFRPALPLAALVSPPALSLSLALSLCAHRPADYIGSRTHVLYSSARLRPSFRQPNLAAPQAQVWSYPTRPRARTWA